MSNLNPRNMSDVIGIITAVRRDAQAQAKSDRDSGDLTREGLRNRHEAWAKERKWAEFVDDAQSRAAKTVDGRRAKVEKLRAAVTAHPTDTNKRMLGEMVFARRRHIVDTLIENRAAVSEIAAHIESASPDEVPVLVEYLRDAAAARRADDSILGTAHHPFADALTEAIDQGVDARNPEIATAAEALSAAEQAAEYVDVQAKHTRAVLDDPTHEVPAYVEMWANNDNSGADSIPV